MLLNACCAKMRKTLSENGELMGKGGKEESRKQALFHFLSILLDQKKKKTEKIIGMFVKAIGDENATLEQVCKAEEICVDLMPQRDTDV